MPFAKRLSARTDDELILLIDMKTGQLLMERLRPGYPLKAREATIRHYHTGIVCDVEVALQIQGALDEIGVDVVNIKDKCLKIKEDLIGQLLSVMYVGLGYFGGETVDYLKELSVKWRIEEIGEHPVHVKSDRPATGMAFMPRMRGRLSISEKV